MNLPLAHLGTQWGSTSAAADQALMHAGCMHGEADTRPASRYFSPQSQRLSYISIKLSELIGPDGIESRLLLRQWHQRVCGGVPYMHNFAFTKPGGRLPRVVPISAAHLAAPCLLPVRNKRDRHNSCTASTHARHTRDSGKSCMTWRAAHCTHRSRISTWRHSSTHLEVLPALYPGLQCLLVTRIFPDVCLA
jgi:hypothetical protein